MDSESFKHGQGQENTADMLCHSLSGYCLTGFQRNDKGRSFMKETRAARIITALPQVRTWCWWLPNFLPSLFFHLSTWIWWYCHHSHISSLLLYNTGLTVFALCINTWYYLSAFYEAVNDPVVFCCVRHLAPGWTWLFQALSASPVGLYCWNSRNCSKRQSCKKRSIAAEGASVMRFIIIFSFLAYVFLQVCSCFWTCGSCIVALCPHFDLSLPRRFQTNRQ